MKNWKLSLVLAMVGFLASTTAQAAMILEFSGSSSSGATNQNQALAKLVVGGSDVTIGSFGVFGQARANGNVKFVIFDAATPSASVYLSSAQPVTAKAGTFAEGAQWYDSPAIDFTLLAGHSYAMGLMSDQVGTNTFYWGNTYSAFGGGTTIVGGNLSMPFMQALCNSGLSSGVFAATPTLYTVNNSNRYMMSLRVAPAAPEPATIALLCMGGLGIIGRRIARA